MQKLKDLLKVAYPDSHQQIFDNLQSDMVSHLVGGKKDDDWYKSAQIYVTYPEVFSGSGSSFDALAEKIDHIKGLGCDTIHILPFLKSPMIDAGFDVSDYIAVRDDLGGNQAFKTFISKAKKHDVRILMDLILNHTSNQHEWFQKAINGDEKYRNYYVHSPTKPEFIKEYTKENPTWAKYVLGEKEVKMRIIFPEQAGELPHWEKAKDGYWYYHTFYPHQIDLDWNNPDVFEEFVRIFIYWNQKGASFRLDAIPFIGKDVFAGTTETTPFTHQIVKALHYINSLTSSSSAFLVEAVQPIEITKKYFGDSTDTESELAYNFSLNMSIWLSLVKKDPQHIWDSIEETYHIPGWAQWITFLRNHDQIMLEFIVGEDRKKIFEDLTPKGLTFMEGLGVAGRMADFLESDERRIVMAHALLASLPGTPALYYGDEIGQTNNHDYMKEQTKLKRESENDPSISDDHRDINRGPFDQDTLDSPEGKSIYKQVCQIFSVRNKLGSISTTIPQKISSSSDSIFAAKYNLSDSDIEIYINFSDQEKEISVRTTGETMLSLNDSHVQDQVVHLGSYGVIWLKTHK